MSQSSITQDEKSQHTSQQQQQHQKKGFSDPLGDRMKEYEAKFSLKLDKDKPWIVRLDGHHFSKFTKGFKKPFDERFSNVMTKTTCDLVKEFIPTLAFTQSDEITLVFPALPLDSPSEQIYGGRVSKIVSLMASFCAVRFNFYLALEEFDPNTEKGIYEKSKAAIAYFDARAFSIENEVEAAQNVLWRSYVDYRRNSILNLGFAHFSHKEMHGWATVQVLENLEKKGISWNTYPDHYRFGVFVKKSTYQKEALDPKTNEMVLVTRSQIVTRSFDLQGYHKSHVQLLFSKYWEDYDSFKNDPNNA